MDVLTISHTAVGTHEPPAVKPNKFSIRKCRFQDAVGEMEDALQHGEHSFECSSEDDATVPEFTEQEAPMYHEEARHASRKKTSEKEDGEDVARESKAAKVDANDDIPTREDIFAEEDEEDRMAQLRACCRVLDLVHKEPRPGFNSHFVCQHGGYPPGTTCDECEQEAEQRAIAAFSGRFEFGDECNGQRAVVWANTDTGDNYIDLVTISCQESVHTSIEVCYSGDRFNIRHLAYNTTVFWSAIFLFLETGSSGHTPLDESLSTAFSAASDED